MSSYLATTALIGFAFCLPHVALVDLSATTLNAHTRSLSAGWDCLSGYLQTGNDCRRITLPNKAYRTVDADGRGRGCSGGYGEGRNGCARIAMPANAHPTSGTDRVGWACDRGFKRSGKTCQTIELPASSLPELDGTIEEHYDRFFDAKR